MKIIKNFRHVGIVTQDLNKSLWFYKKLLGLKIKTRMYEYGATTEKLVNVKNAKINTVKLFNNKNSILIELLHFKNVKKSKNINYNIKRTGCSHFAITVNDIDNIYKRLSKYKIKFLSEPTLSNDKNVKLAFCRAPEGTLIEMVEEKNNK